MQFDTIVVGAGAMGSSAAYWLSKSQNVMLIDQFNLLHAKGSSHGQSRIIRKTYRQTCYANLVEEAYNLWAGIQNESNSTLYKKTGGLDFGREGNPDMKSTQKICEKVGIDYEILNSRQVKSRFPAYNVDEDHYGIYQPETGILNATKSVEILQTLAAKNGTTFIQNQKVLQIKPIKDKVRIITNQNEYHAHSVVLTAGSWINQVLLSINLKLKIKIWKLTFAYYKTLKNELFQSEKFPVFIAWEDDVVNYGFPLNERENYLKIGAHYNNLIVKVDENNGVNNINVDLLKNMTQYIGHRFNSLDPHPNYAETCYYTMTENEDFIIDYLPDHSNIIVVGGFSGHGFKFSPIIGKIVSDMILNNDISWNMSSFKIDQYLL